jgi:hypothetical protein
MAFSSVTITSYSVIADKNIIETANAKPNKPPTAVARRIVPSDARDKAGATWRRNPNTAIDAAANPVPVAAVIINDPTTTIARP